MNDINTKPFYRSKTVWGALTVIFAAGYQMIAGGNIDNLLEFVGGIVALIGRATATQRIF